MVSTRKFSEFDNAGNLSNNKITVGYDLSKNVQYNNPWTFIASGATGDRPAPSPDVYYRLRFNTSLLQYEFYNPLIAGWTQLGDNTSTVVSGQGTANQVLVNGTTGSPQFGNLVFSLPQSIATTSSPSFAALSLSNPLMPQYGGTGIANGSSNTLALQGPVAFLGTFSVLFNFTANTNVTFPSSGILATTSMIPALPLSIVNGGTGSSSVISNTTINSWAGWDSNGLLSANNFTSGYGSTTTNGGTKVLTASTGGIQFFTGTNTHTLQMPDTSTLKLGQSWRVGNNSTGVVTIVASDSSSILAMPSQTHTVVTCISTSDTSSAGWDVTNTSDAEGVTTLTGTANQVIASAPSGAVTLSLPQNIDTNADVQFHSLTFSNTGNGGIVGTTTNNSAASGYVGQIIESTVNSGSAVSLTTVTATNITSISLTAGDWNVWGVVYYQPAAALTTCEQSISTTSAAMAIAPNGGAISRYVNAFSNAGIQGLPCGMRRLSLSSTTTVYLVALASFTSTCSSYGYIGARRIR